NQPAEHAEIDRVHILPVYFFLRRLQYHRPIPKPRVVHQEPERLQADFALADVGMAIDPATERLAAVFEMKIPSTRQSDSFIEVSKSCLVLLPRPQRVTGGENVAGNEADAEPARFLH